MNDRIVDLAVPVKVDSSFHYLFDDVTMPDLRSSERWREVAHEDPEAVGATPAWRTISLVRA